MGLDINLNTSKIDISEDDGLNVDLYKDNIDISDDEAEDIIIEITGLKSINKFIGLEDTPLYYDNGKFFKVENNKIIYTDIEWKDITGDINDAPDLINLIKILISEISESIIDKHIIKHNTDNNAHPYIQNIIEDNYTTLNNKIDNVETEITQDISELENALNTEIENRENADDSLSDRIDGLDEDIQEEILARVENDTTLQNNINSVVSDLSDEISARESADTTLSNSISDLSDGLIQEITDRQTADTGLQSQITSNYNTLDSKIDSVESSLSNNINDLSDTVDANDTAINNKVDNINNTLTNSISTLSTTVSNNYTTLNNKIDSVNDTLSSDISDLSDTVSSNYTTLDNKIDDVNSDLSDDISTLSGTVSSNYTTLDNKIDSVEGTLADSITALDNKYDSITSGLDDKIDDVDDTLTTHISDNSNPHNVTKTQVGLSNVDNTSDLDKPISTATQTALDGISNNLTSHTSNTNNPHNVTKTQISLGNVDNTSDLNKPISTATQTALDGKVPNTRTVNNKPLSSDIVLDYSDVNALPDTTTINDLTTTAQQNALNSGIDSTLTQQITTNQNNISNLSSTVSSNYTTLDNRITSEVNTLNGSISDEETARINADNGLQSQIDAITSASDVTDIVGTYAELQAYDTTGLPDKSIIKVLQDESRNDETTYYRWVITNGTGAWVLIGEEGPYYTKSEADGKFVNQTTTINNKALSSDITLTASDVGALPDNTVIGDGTLTIQKNGTTIDTFTANTTSNKTINITVPTDTQDLTNGAGYITNSALNGYATENFVLNQGYITGITSTDVTTALGYVPYNSTNPSGYTTNVGTVTSVNNTQPDANGNVTLVIPDTATWGNISGTLSNQTDLQNTLNLKVNSSDLATVATTGSYTDLINKPYVTTNTGITYVGGDSSASTSGTALGYSAKTTGVFGISIGRGAKSQADYAYQIGLGNNTTSYSLSIGFGTAKTYTLLDGNTGLIPDARLSSNIARISDIPTDTNDLTNGAGYITSSALNGYATETWVGNQGYITGITSSDVTTALGYTPYDSSNPNGYTSNVGTVTSVNNIQPINGDVTLSIPSVGDGTITINQGGITKGTFTVNQSGDTTIDLDAGGSITVDQTYDPSSINAQSGVAIAGAGFLTGITSSDVTTALGYTPYNSTNPSGYITSSALTNYVTTNTAQNISGKKTFLGEKAIYFKQNATSDKLGFTLYNPSNSELAALEWRPNTIGRNSLLALNCPQATGDYVGFRYWGSPAVNIVAPKVATAGNYYIPVNLTDGTNTVTANNNGTLNISTLLPDVSNFITNSSLATTLTDYQPLLVSGTNIKTINNTSLLGSGNISVQPTITSSAMLSSDLVDDTNKTHKFATSAQLTQIATNTSDISSEITNRQNADNNLQSQIDAIVSSSDVFDIVGTYAELQAYDISTVPVNDIIKVLVDNTHSNAATYYRCVESGGVKSWSYIGSEGAYYTKSEADGRFVAKTITVNGQALSSNVTLTASDVGALPDSTVIPTVNNGTLTIQKNGTTVSTFTANDTNNVTANISVPTSISDLTDDTSTYPIDKAESVVDNNSGSLTFWSGTKAEYDAIVTKDANTLYNVEDTTSPIISILESLYPVGSIYIGTMSACPLQTLGIGTWQLVATDRVLQGAGTRGSVGDTLNESLPNITGSFRVVGSNSATSWASNMANQSGAFYPVVVTTGTQSYVTAATNTSANTNDTGFNASRSSSTYQNNAPVQQDAYLVNIWERIS